MKINSFIEKFQNVSAILYPQQQGNSSTAARIVASHLLLLSFQERQQYIKCFFAEIAPLIGIIAPEDFEIKSILDFLQMVKESLKANNSENNLKILEELNKLTPSEILAISEQKKYVYYCKHYVPIQDLLKTRNNKKRQLNLLLKFIRINQIQIYTAELKGIEKKFVNRKDFQKIVDNF